MPVKAKRVVTGEYNRCGYTVLLDGQEIYSAGNAPGDSTLRVPVEYGISLACLRRFCAQTACEIAGEKKAEYGGIERVPDLDDREL